MAQQAPTPVQVLLVGVALALGLFLRQHVFLSKARKYPLPPGPSGLPLIGNVLDVPTGEQWLGYDKMFKIYGDMFYLTALGTPMLVIGSSRRARDLLEKRSTINSDRPHFTMSYELIGFGYLFNEQHYGDWWRRHRRAFHEFFHAGAVNKYLPVQTAASRQLLRRLSASPDKLFHHIKHTFSSSILKIVYDIDVHDADDQYVALAERAMDIFATTLLPGPFWVDFMPLLKYVPSWMPGAGFKRKAANWRPIAIDFRDRPFKAVSDALHRGESPTCMAATLIDNLPKDARRAEEEQVAKDVSAVAYAGGADTTTSAVESFFLAMLLFPDVQKKAQAEIDSVIGSDRLPEFEDRAALPYIQALIKEVMRWQLVTPLAAPHRTTEEQVYDGYYIPKGTVILANCWSILHDPEVYPDPEAFQPDRFLKNGEIDSTVPDPGSYGAFGYGRRICPGRYLSDNSLYSIISSVLAVFDIGRIPGEPLPSTEMVPGIISYPVKFKCTIKPRSAAAEALIAAIGAA